MALKDDDKKKKLAAAAKSSSAKSTPSKSTPAPAKTSTVTRGSMPTYSGKPAKSNPFETRKAGMPPPAKPKPQSPVMVQPSPKMGKDPSGSANFNRTAPSRATITAGPAKLPVGGKTTKSSGGIDYTKGNVMPEKQDNSTAKMSPGTKKPGSPSVPNTKIQYGGYKDTNSVPIAVAGGAATLGAGIALSGVGKKIVAGGKKLVNYIATTKERKEARKQQNADNKAELERRKAEAEAKNPSTPVGKNSKISKSTMKKLKKK
jgi:hypothetical protein